MSFKEFKEWFIEEWKTILWFWYWPKEYYKEEKNEKKNNSNDVDNNHNSNI